MTDDFFDKLDKKISEQESADRVARNQTMVNREFSHEAIRKMLEIATSYKGKLRERDIHAEISGNQRGFSFKMIWADGGHRALEVYPDLHSGRIQFHTAFTNDDGRNLRSTDGASYDAGNWKDEDFEPKLKKLIDDFVFYADRHGGLKFDRR